MKGFLITILLSSLGIISLLAVVLGHRYFILTPDEIPIITDSIPKNITKEILDEKEKLPKNMTKQSKQKIRLRPFHER